MNQITAEVGPTEEETVEGKYIERVAYQGGLDDASYLRGVPAVAWLLSGQPLCFRRDVTIFAGENGSGKSTLLEAIAVAGGFNPEGGSTNFTFSTSATHSPLYRHLSVSKTRHEKDGFFLRAEGFYNLATNVEELDALPAAAPPISRSYGGKSLHCQSHGESFLAAVQNRFGGRGLYLLDEPEAALSPMKQLTLLCEISALVEKDSQFIIATHSPILMAFPGAEVLWLSERGIEPVEYRETEHYQVTKRFLSDPERMLRHLLGHA